MMQCRETRHARREAVSTHLELPGRRSSLSLAKPEMAPTAVKTLSPFCNTCVQLGAFAFSLSEARTVW